VPEDEAPPPLPTATGPDPQPKEDPRAATWFKAGNKAAVGRRAPANQVRARKVGGEFTEPVLKRMALEFLSAKTGQMTNVQYQCGRTVLEYGAGKPRQQIEIRRALEESAPDGTDIVEIDPIAVQLAAMARGEIPTPTVAAPPRAEPVTAAEAGLAVVAVVAVDDEDAA
jgi:hypothetical protein